MTLRTHYWLTILAVVIVFAAGSAFALILFKGKLGSPDPQSGPEQPKLDVVPPKAWADTTLERLQKSLNLRAEQIESIRKDVEDAELEVAYVREGAMLEYHLLLLRLHDQIAGKVDAGQQAKLAESRKALELIFEKRLSAISDDLPGHQAPAPRKKSP